MTPDDEACFEVVVIGGGQAGLAASYWLTQRGIRHVVLERARIAEAWRSERWDTFCLVTPNWQCRLPGFPYDGSDPHGYMSGAEVVEYIAAYARSFGAPVREGVSVHEVTYGDEAGRFTCLTSEGTFLAQHVVLAIGGYHVPVIPEFASEIPKGIVQLDAASYRNPSALPPGEVLVVGSGQSGCQIAEDLHLAGRSVHLCLGPAPRSPRMYRGRDVVAWLEDMGHYDTPIESFADQDAVRRKTNHYVTGRDGGREIDLRARALEHLRLYGYLRTIEDGRLVLADDVRMRLDQADDTYMRIRAMIDAFILERGISAPEPSPYLPCWIPGETPTTLDLADHGISAVIWCIGFRQDFGFVKLPVTDERGEIMHQRGITPVSGVYVLGLPWLYTWGSGRLCGVGRDAAYVVEHIANG